MKLFVVLSWMLKDVQRTTISSYCVSGLRSTVKVYFLIGTKLHFHPDHSQDVQLQALPPPPPPLCALISGRGLSVEPHVHFRVDACTAISSAGKQQRVDRLEKERCGYGLLEPRSVTALFESKIARATNASDQWLRP